MQILQQYWWAMTIYFLVGFIAYWVTERLTLVKNSFLEGVAVAIIWGAVWPLLAAIYLITKFEIWFKEKYSQTLVVLHAIGAGLWLYLSVRMILNRTLVKLLLRDFVGFALVLGWISFGYYLIKRIGKRPPLFPYERKIAEEIKEKQKKAQQKEDNN